MLTYNTHLKKLLLPEYGRNVQKMVDHCMSIEDSSERNRCALSIVRTMATMFPEHKDSQNGANPYRKFWDHLAIMSGFALDIDWPEGTIEQEKLTATPEPVPMTQGPMRFNVYGKNVQRMMEYAVDMPGGEEKDALIMLLANQMKKQLTSVFPDGVDDRRIFKDIADMTDGAIRLSEEFHRLTDYKLPQQPVAGSKKKRKR